ncbi:MAG: hypothetical protein ACAH27_17155 [Xanthobacteraceae bacterium]
MNDLEAIAKHGDLAKDAALKTAALISSSRDNSLQLKLMLKEIRAHQKEISDLLKRNSRNFAGKDLIRLLSVTSEIYQYLDESIEEKLADLKSTKLEVIIFNLKRYIKS